MPEGEIDDILKELRSHITDLEESRGGDVEAAVRSLGDPVDMAGRYLADHQMVRAECSGSPLVILQGLRHATRSALGRFVATLLYVFGYANVVTLLGAAIEKVLSPASVGLWYVPGHPLSLSLVTGGQATSGARELLGWWLTPVALLAGWALKSVTDQAARWWIRRQRREREAESP